MQQQKPGQGQQSDQNPNKNQDVRNEGNANRPEVENPQPTRKVEEPIVGNSMEAGSNDKNQGDSSHRSQSGSDSRNQTGSTERTSGGAGQSEHSNMSKGSQDYQKSDAGFQPDQSQKDRGGQQKSTTQSESSGKDQNRQNT